MAPLGHMVDFSCSLIPSQFISQPVAQVYLPQSVSPVTSFVMSVVPLQVPTAWTFLHVLLIVPSALVVFDANQ